ncbi:MAG: PASTA domain-containing protein [Candidatus Riflebacteria bacterium]|nr:PASTA domain-containing protein [Candidatus Riflebacteria bacterium]
MAKKESCLLIMVKMVLMLTILLAAIIAGGLYLKDVANEYFNRGESIEVPDFRGKHLVDVIKEKPADLNIEKSDEKFDPRYPKDHVIAQYPEAGSRVKRNKKIMLTISKGNKQVTVPDMIEKNPRESVLALLNAQLKEGNRAYIFSAKTPRERIITQSPLPFASHEINGGVDMLISLGPGSVHAPLPNLIGKSLSDAKTTITALGLKEGKIVYKKDSAHPKDKLLSSRPAPYEMVGEGTSIDMLVSSGNDPGSTNTDDLKRFEIKLDAPPPQNGEAPAVNVPAPPRIIVGDEDNSTTGKEKKPPKTTATLPAQAQPDISAAKPDVDTDTDTDQPGQTPEETPAADTTKPAGPKPGNDTTVATKGETTTVSFTMPDGFMPKEVKFIMLSSQGRQEVYSGTHKPLDLIRVKVPKLPDAKIQIYINDISIEERNL